ncbi:MAG: mandelate racemase/muconate lactonizing enzyme family protein [Acetobacterales bacterium]
MKIASVEAVPIVVPMQNKIAAPIAIPRADEVAHVVFGQYRTVLVRIRTEDGIEGVGEIMTRLAAKAYKEIVDDIAPLLIGRDARDIEGIWDLLWSVMVNRGHVKGFYVEAMSGIDIALWDIFGKSVNLPVWRLLGGDVNPKIWCYASSLRFRGLDILLKEVEHYKSIGFNAMKIKIGKNPLDYREDIKAVEALRKAAGDDVVLMADVNCGYGDNPKTALQVGRELERLGLYWYEEPLSPEDVDGYAFLRDKLDIRIATGEADFTRFNIAPFLARAAVDIIQPDACRVGGLSETRKIAEMASAFHCAFAPHTGSCSVIAMIVGLHLARAMPNFLVFEYMHSDWNKEQQNPLRWDLCEMPIEKFEDSHITMKDCVGLGIELNEEVVEKYRVDR